MILIALGANLPSCFGSPADTLEAAKHALETHGIKILKSSCIWLTAPVPFEPDQDWYHNSVIAVETELVPYDLLQIMLAVETEFGRVRTVKNAPRILDLDLIAYHNEVIKEGDRLIVPHPRMHKRLFVLKPLEEIFEDWTHPETGQCLADMISNCSDDQQVKLLAKPLEEEEAHA